MAKITRSFVLYSVYLFLLIILICCVNKSNCQCSTYSYVIQPPQPLGCNPFTPDRRWALTTECAADSADENSPVFEIRWMRRNPGSSIVEDLGSNQNTYSPNVPRASGTLNFLNEPFTESMLGQYWCEVYINELPTGAYSDGFTILRPEEYDDTELPTCPGAIPVRGDINNGVCRDEPPEPIQTVIQSSSQRLFTSSTTTAVSSLSHPSSIAITLTESTLSASSTTKFTTSAKIFQSKISVVSSERVPPTTMTIKSTSISSTSSVLTIMVNSSPSISQMVLIPKHSNIIVIETSAYTPIIGHSSMSISDTVSSSLVQPVQTVIQEGTEIDTDMSYLLLTAIILIVILAVIIILLIVIIYLTKCGRQPLLRSHKKTRSSIKNRIHGAKNTRPSQIELLPAIEDNFDTAYVSQTCLPTVDDDHRYSEIRDSTLTASNLRNGNHSGFPALIPPAIIRSKSSLVNNSQTNTTKDNKSKSNQFSYSRLNDAEYYSECVPRNDGKTMNGNTETQTNNLKQTELDRSSCKVEKIRNEMQEDWDYEWNPMYMKLPLENIRVVNTL